MCFQVFQVVAHRPVADYGHTPANTSQNGRGFIWTEINTRLATDLFEDISQHVLRLLFRQPRVYPSQKIGEERPDLLDLHLEVHYRRG